MGSGIVTKPEETAGPEPVVEILPQSDPAPEVTSFTEPKAEAPRKSGFVPMLLGGVIAAGLGAGAAIYALPYLPASLLPQQVDEAGLRAEIAALKTALTQQKDAVSAQISAIPQPDLAPLAGRLDRLEARVEEQAKALEMPADLTARLAQMEQLLSTSSEARAQIAQAAAEAAAQITAAQKQAEGMKAAAEAAAQREKAEAAIAQATAALKTGVALPEALAALSAAGLSASALTADLPTLSALQEGFAEPAREALAASRKAVAGGTFGDKVGAFLLAQTGMRSLEPQEGADPDAVLSRAEATISTDLAAALTEISALPPEGQAALAAWVAQAQRYLDATKALGALAPVAQ